MKSSLMIFLISFIVALPVGYFIFDADNDSKPVEETSTIPSDEKEESELTKEVVEVSDEARALQVNGCVSCHAVDSLQLDGPATGPDLSSVYLSMESKHGVSLEEFLVSPTTAVMASVIDSYPLSEEAIADIVEALRVASE